MFIYRILTIIYCSFVFQLSTVSQAADDNKVVIEERQGRLNPSLSKITDINFWEQDNKNSWYIAVKYLSFSKENEPEIYQNNKNFLKCVAASFLRINYRLIDSADLEAQGKCIRDFEPSIAYLTMNNILPINTLWLNALPEIEGDFSRESEGMMRVMNSGSPARFLTILPSSYQGVALWVGGERTENNLHKDKYIINIDKDMKPDMLADGTAEHTFAVLPSNKFREIFFDHLAHIVLTGDRGDNALKECYRILQPGGVLKFRTEHADNTYYLNLLKEKDILKNIEERLKENNFSNLRVLFKNDSRDEWRSVPTYIEVEAVKQ